MAQGRPARSFVKAYLAYCSVLEALGYEVDEAEVLAHVADAPQTRTKLCGFLAAYRSGALDGELVARQVCERAEELLVDLASQIEPEARRLADAGVSGPFGAEHGSLSALVAGLPDSRRDWIADIVALSGHRELVRPRKMAVEEFQKLLRDFAGDQTLARRKLIAHMRAELLRRGVDMSCEAIEERFRSDPAVRTMPYCIKEVFRGLGPEYRTGLVPMRRLIRDRDADEWLRHVQRKLLFRSQSAMHKAVADATALSYHRIHKALSGKHKAKRIHIRVKRCLERWLRMAERGQDIEADERYRGVRVAQMWALAPRLREVFPTKEAAYRFISSKTGIRAGSVRRYFQADGQLRFAPLSVYRVATQLAEGVIQPPRSGASTPTKRNGLGALERAATETQHALGRWRQDRRNSELEREFKDLRRALIARLKARRADSLVAV